MLEKRNALWGVTGSNPNESWDVVPSHTLHHRGVSARMADSAIGRALGAFGSWYLFF